MEVFRPPIVALLTPDVKWDGSIPLTYGADALHGAVHGGNTLPIALDLGILCAYGVGLFLLSLFNIRRRWIA